MYKVISESLNNEIWYSTVDFSLKVFIRVRTEYQLFRTNSLVCDSLIIVRAYKLNYSVYISSYIVNNVAILNDNRPLLFKKSLILKRRLREFSLNSSEQGAMLLLVTMT